MRLQFVALSGRVKNTCFVDKVFETINRAAVRRQVSDIAKQKRKLQITLKVATGKQANTSQNVATHRPNGPLLQLK